MDWIKDNDINLQETAEYLGYSKTSISNNWSKQKKVPKKAEVAFKLYLENKKLKESKDNSDKKNDTLSGMLPMKAIELANEKCTNHGLELEEYITSLIISNI